MTDMVGAVEQLNAELARNRILFDQATADVNELRRQLAEQEDAYDKMRREKENLSQTLEASISKYESLKEEFPNTAILRRAMDAMREAVGESLVHQQSEVSETLYGCQRQYQETLKRREEAERRQLAVKRTIEELAAKMNAMTGVVEE